MQEPTIPAGLAKDIQGYQMDKKNQMEMRPCVPSLRGYYRESALATILGIMVVFLLNLATPMGFIHEQMALVLQERDSGALVSLAASRIVIFLLLNSSVCALVFWAIALALRPIASALKHWGKETPDSLLDEARRRLLNLPFILIAVHVGLWVILPSLVFFTGFLLGNMNLHTALVLSLRASMVGFVASSFAFYGTEAYSREHLIPLFFPEGRLTELKGAARISISRRIRMFYRLGSGVPVGILLLTLVTLQMEVEDTTVSASTYGRGILVFVTALSAIFFVSSGILNRMITRSIVEPINSMIRLVGKIREGDYSARIPVVSNDEIGILGDAGNVMIRGLGDRDRIHAAFGRYVTPEIRDEILAGRIPLHGERKEATILFSDLCGFTPYVEEHAPEEVMSSLREYFTGMHECIRKQGGLVLQFAGDQIEAVFGVPLPFADHADAALRAAWDMRAALVSLNQRRSQEGKTPFAHGIGIHTGKVLAGNSGSKEQSAYALIGDTVNVASRIEKLTRELGSDILITGDTLSALRGAYPIEPRGDLLVKGYSKRVSIHAV